MQKQTGARAVLVTGGAGELGRVTAQAFAARGDRVAICDIDGDAARRTADDIVAAGGIASSYAVDISDAAQVEQLIADVVARYGQLDVAFNNAGISGGRAPISEADEATFDRCIEINLKGTWLCMKHEIRQMLAQGGGIIVNNSSVTGLKGSVGAAYCASKHGITGLTKSAALVYAGRGVRVNAVCPGLIDGGLGRKLIERFADQPQALMAGIPAGCAGVAQDVANAVLWLSSDEASFTHGHLLTVDGGYMAH